MLTKGKFNIIRNYIIFSNLFILITTVCLKKFFDYFNRHIWDKII
jgi:hypothetical protein